LKKTPYIFHLFLIGFVLYASIGVSVFLDIEHASKVKVEFVEDDSCQHIEKVEEAIKVSHCCCITEHRFAQFYFNNTIVDKVEVPSFLTAFVCLVQSQKLELKTFAVTLHHLDLPPPKTIPQKLSLLQVYRL
jgi:hypothetical protein